MIHDKNFNEKKMHIDTKSSCENVPYDMYESLYKLHSNYVPFETLWSGFDKLEGDVVNPEVPNSNYESWEVALVELATS